MSAGKRIKQLLMVTGLLTVLAGVALVGMIVYVWWDTRDPADEFAADTTVESETDFDTSGETDLSDDATDIGTTDTESKTDTDSESGTTAD